MVGRLNKIINKKKVSFLLSIVWYKGWEAPVRSKGRWMDG